MRTRNKILLGLGIIALILIILFILCYFFDWPFPVFCCYFHNWWNNNSIPFQNDWQCNYSDGGGGVTYTCTSSYPSCGGSCPSGEICVDYYNTATMEEGCKCVPIVPEDTGPLCGTLDFPYCDDGSCPTGQWCQGVYDETGPHCECSPECSDTDGYADIREYGVCTDFSGSWEDHCNQDSTLTEFWCEDHYCNWDIYECGAGYYCWLGECKLLPNCNLECAKVGEMNGGYFTGGVSCDDWEKYLPEFGCCCYEYP